MKPCRLCRRCLPDTAYHTTTVDGKLYRRTACSDCISLQDYARNTAKRKGAYCKPPRKTKAEKLAKRRQWYARNKTRLTANERARYWAKKGLTQ
jgi:hypothetical protein